MRDKRGFIKIIIIVIAALVLLKYVYNIDVVGFLTTGKFKGWLDKLYQLASLGWGKYNVIIIKIWNYLIGLLKNIFNK